MKTNYVEIQSQVTIRVTPGLQNNDVTNKDAHVADRLKVSSTWPTCTQLIRKGMGTYSACILEWPTVKALIESKTITVAGEFETIGDTEKAKEADTLSSNYKNIRPKKIKSVNLESLS